MDPPTDLAALAEDLEVNIDELSTVLAPLLSTPLSTTASSLPLLDKAKLYVLAAYAIESLLFSALQATGVPAKEHAVFTELARLKRYFGKIKETEARGAPAQKAPRLNVAAAQRFIKHGLAGNERYDLERAERIAKEKAKAAVREAMRHKRFDDEVEEKKKEEGQEAVPAKKRSAEDEEADEESDDSDAGAASAQPSPKKPRLDSSSAADTDSAPTPTTKKPKHSKRKSKSKHSSDAASTSSPTSPSEPNDTAMPDAPSTSHPSTPKQRRPKKKKGIKKLPLTGGSDNEEAVLPAKPPANAPATRSETFSALLDGSLAEKVKKKKSKEKSKKKDKEKGKAK